MTDLHLHWNEGKGHMIIHMDNFFPATQNKLKQLCTKVINLDLDRDEKLNTIMDYLKEAEKTALQEKKILANEYSTEMTKQGEMKRNLSEGRLSNGVPLKKDERKQLREDLKAQKGVTTDLMNRFKEQSRKASKLKGNQELLKEIYGGSWE